MVESDAIIKLSTEIFFSLWYLMFCLFLVCLSVFFFFFFKIDVKKRLLAQTLLLHLLLEFGSCIRVKAVLRDWVSLLFYVVDTYRGSTHLIPLRLVLYSLFV